MQPAANASRSLGKRVPPLAWQAATGLPSTVPEDASATSAAVPSWLIDLEQKAAKDAERSQRSVEADGASSNPSSTSKAQGVHYNLFLGANLKMFSSAKAEQHLKNMHEPNHRELAISKFAARVADLLWPGCQDNVDEAIAKHKQMVSKSRVHVPEPEYVPPSVPHLLPVTNWIRNNEELRESFVCDSNTIYKPRMAWYNPNDGMIPSGWLTEGLLADLAYYKPFTGKRKPEQAWK